MQQIYRTINGQTGFSLKPIEMKNTRCEEISELKHQADPSEIAIYDFETFSAARAFGAGVLAAGNKHIRIAVFEVGEKYHVMLLKLHPHEGNGVIKNALPEDITVTEILWL